MSTDPQNPPRVEPEDLERLAGRMDPAELELLHRAARRWAEIKEKGGKVVVATGSGPHLHEGVTVLIAELVRRGLVDGVLTSSAVVAHELAGSLERVRRVDGRRLGWPAGALPADGMVEVALLSPEQLAFHQRHTELDLELYRRMLAAPGHEIIKVAGNLAYPTGLWLERLARRLLPLAQARGITLEEFTGPAADPRTMLGACARRGVPLVVTVPQLVGGGQVGLCIADSVSITRRSSLVAGLLASADLILESGVALTQEIHDGPFELYTGHGLWAHHEGMPCFSLEKKDVVRLDLDPALKAAWQRQRRAGEVAAAIDRGRPKAVSLGLAFRMEMSGFARLPGSLPVTCDLGVAWPLLAHKLASLLGVKLDFLCYKQGTDLGERIREYIVRHLAPLDPAPLMERGGQGRV